MPVVTPVKRGTPADDVPVGLLPLLLEEDEEVLGSLLSETLDESELVVESFFLVPKLVGNVNSSRKEKARELTGRPDQLRGQSPQASPQAGSTIATTAVSACRHSHPLPTLAYYHPSQNHLLPISASPPVRLPCLIVGSSPLRQQRPQLRRCRGRDLPSHSFGSSGVGCEDWFPVHKLDQGMQ